MTILATETNETDYSRSATFTCEKTSAYVAVYKDSGRVNVCCLNAANRTWRGCGKFFENMTEAMGAYKSGAMKAILETAKAELSA